MCQDSTPSCRGDKQAYHIANEPPLEVEDLFHRQKKQDQYVPKVHIPTRGRRPLCVDFYIYGTWENGVEDKLN